jgi:hydroxymethylglutaryl-CoA synthase
MMAGIVGYGAYCPTSYVETAEIDESALALGLLKKSVASWDEDSVTMAVEAGREALATAGIKAQELGAVYVGSESPPYAVNPMSTIVADILGVGDAYRAVDLQFACKAATAGMQMAMGEVQGGHHDYALVIGSDAAQAAPGNVLEWSAGAAAAALLVGNTGVLAHVVSMTSVTSDTPDFWRREQQEYPSHGGRFTGEPAYFAHVVEASRRLMVQESLTPDDFTYAVFHMPNGRFPVEAARRLGFSFEQVEPSLTVREVGNPYSASAMLGLIALLERLKPGEKILMTAYGSGAGADAMILEGTKELKKRRWGKLQELFLHRNPMSWGDYKTSRRLNGCAA